MGERQSERMTSGERPHIVTRRKSRLGERGRQRKRGRKKKLTALGIDKIRGREGERNREKDRETLNLVKRVRKGNLTMRVGKISLRRVK